jgi:CubicO group peptidase (beta-lactamase class C family)
VFPIFRNWADYLKFYADRTDDSTRPWKSTRIFRPFSEDNVYSMDMVPWIWSLRPRSTEHGAPYVYSGDDINLAEKALELLTGKPVIALLYEQFQRPFAEPVSQFDLGTGTRFTAMYLAKVGQMILQDGA